MNKSQNSRAKQRSAPTSKAISGIAARKSAVKMAMSYVQPAPKPGQRVKFGKSDNTPQFILSCINASPTGRNALSKLATFIAADGFENAAVHTRKASKKQNVGQLCELLAQDLAELNAMAVVVKVTPLGEMGAAYHLPVFRVRVIVDEDLRVVKYSYNPTIGTDNEKPNAYYDMPIWEGDDTPEKRARNVEIMKAQNEEHGEQRGFVFYTKIYTTQSDYYGIPQYTAGLDDFESEAEALLTEKEYSKDGYKDDLIISQVGTYSDVPDPETGKSDKQQIKERLNNFAERKDRILMLTSATPEGIAEVDVVSNATAISSLGTGRDRVGRAICRHVGVPPVLCGFTQPEGLGNTQALVNSFDMFQQFVLKYQNVLSEFIRDLFPGIDGGYELTSLRLIRYLPPEVIASLTPDEVRALGGYPPLATDSGSEQLLSERLGVGGTQSLVSIVSDPLLTPAQKSALLQELFGLSPEATLKITGE